jgi:uncharacterized protein
MKVLLDTNIVIAAFAVRGLCESLFELCLDSHEIIFSDELLEEIARNLSKKIKLDQQVISGIERLLRDNTAIFKPAEVSADACRDPNDLHVLGLAKSGKADYIITGDEDLLSLEKFEACKIVSPRQFWTILHDEK